MLHCGVTHNTAKLVASSKTSSCKFLVAQEANLAGAGHRGKVVASVIPKAGRALLHRHGDACLEHEAAPVKSGLKYILRSDVCFVDK